MAIWIGDYFSNRKPLDDDGLILFRAAGNVVYCHEAETMGLSRVFTGDVPPEHPDDIETDRRLLDAMPDTDYNRALRATLPPVQA